MLADIVYYFFFSFTIFSIEGGSGANKLPLKIEKKLNLQDEGIAVDMHQFDTGKCEMN